MMRIFGSVEPKMECIFCYFCKCNNFNHIKLSIHLVPLQGKIDICPRVLFWTKFHAEELLFEGFLAAMRIFGSVINVALQFFAIQSIPLPHPYLHETYSSVVY